MFQLIQSNKISQTRDNSTTGVLYHWIEKIAGPIEAMNVQSWSELAEEGEYYEGENFEVIRID